MSIRIGEMKRRKRWGSSRFVEHDILALADVPVTIVQTSFLYHSFSLLSLMHPPLSISLFSLKESCFITGEGHIRPDTRPYLTLCLRYTYICIYVYQVYNYIFFFFLAKKWNIETAIRTYVYILTEESYEMHYIF